MNDSTSSTPASFISPSAFLAYWLGHQRLTRRVIEAFPDDQLFTFSIGGMRPFGEMAMELANMAAPTVRGILTGEWDASSDRSARPKSEVLRLWDESMSQIEELWPQIPESRFHERMTAFGQWPGPGHYIIGYVLDNEIHHRGQGYVYLRALGIEPPPFWER